MGQFRADLAYEPGPIISNPQTRQIVEFCTGAPRCGQSGYITLMFWGSPALCKRKPCHLGSPHVGKVAT